MQLHTIDTGLFKLDGGAMFGVVPKSIWQKTNPADENNMCTWAMRCLLIEDGEKLILIDNGIGTKQNAKFLSYYYLHGEADLISSIHQAGYSPEQVTDVILTHLHFDHCGGSVQYNASRTGYELTFKNAQYWTNTAHWQWATNPNPRERASFLKENLMPLHESGHLHFIETDRASPFSHIDFIFVDGHTEKMMLPRIHYKGRHVLFVADLLPSVSHIPIAYVMGYDTRPLLTMEEKTQILRQAADENYLLFFEHDPYDACATVEHTEKGVRIGEKGSLADLLH